MTTTDIASLVLRLVVGTIFVAQGYRKTLSPPDASHGRTNLARLISGSSLPAPRTVAWFVGVTELVAGALVLVGALTVAASLALSAVLVAAIGFKLRAGFLGGWDWPLACLGGTLALALLGAGAVSIDALFVR